MPTYEYACRDCGEHLEVVQSFSDDALTECGRCGGSLRKVFSAAGIVFKGSGWYVKDSKASQPKPAKAKGDASESATSGSGDAKGDSSSSDSSAGDSSTGDSSASSSAADKKSA